ncbi:dephospho-CoA kinase [Arcticibacter eurypsychrophilus]|uniref:dephospho-CoA kinase n=1 Tax=Arcticibacter eurypsychrophilus TaxID=1434752 RepID=UPI0029371624|nr:dephospho-CoA kinase [Arcticibacter eurypsychrophilus]
MMLKIGITGGIGTGKTTVCRIFELLGVPVYYADARAKLVMHTDKELIASVKAVFGDEVYSSGVLNRSMLGALVFNDANLLNKLNALVHPAVFRDFKQWSEDQNCKYVLKEAAILFESGSDQDCDYTLLVKSPLSLRISRIMQRDTMSRDDIMKRMDKQMSEEEKEKRADFCVLNDELNLIIPQVLELHKRFVTLSEGKI